MVTIFLTCWDKIFEVTNIKLNSINYLDESCCVPWWTHSPFKNQDYKMSEFRVSKKGRANSNKGATGDDGKENRFCFHLSLPGCMHAFYILKTQHYLIFNDLKYILEDSVPSAQSVLNKVVPQLGFQQIVPVLCQSSSLWVVGCVIGQWRPWLCTQCSPSLL